MTPTLMTPKLPIALAALATLLLSTPALAAGFDCRQAKLPTEVLICRNQVLDPIDEANARIYQTINASLFGDTKHVFNLNGRAWLASRNACGFNVPCVEHAYVIHLREMCNYAGQLGMRLPDCANSSLLGAVDVETQPEQSYATGTVGVDAWDPDPYLTLRTNPTSRYGDPIEKMRNGSTVAIIAKQTDGWWFVQNLTTGSIGWAKSGAGFNGLDRPWIHAAVEEGD